MHTTVPKIVCTYIIVWITSGHLSKQWTFLPSIGYFEVLDFQNFLALVTQAVDSQGGGGCIYF